MALLFVFFVSYFSQLIKTESNKDGSNITASLLFFGTPHTLLNGSNTEKIFFNKLREGYARRLLFSYVESSESNIKLSPEEKYEQMINSAHLENSNELDVYFSTLATDEHYRNDIPISKEAMLLNLNYQKESEEEAELEQEVENELKVKGNNNRNNSNKKNGLNNRRRGNPNSLPNQTVESRNLYKDDQDLFDFN